MDYAVIAFSALIASFLTFFSGFGLGTILTPVFAIFYELEIAIALTAVVHLLNNLFKLLLVYRNINWSMVLRFGIPSMLASFAGAWVLRQMSNTDRMLFAWEAGGHRFDVTWTGLILGLLIVFFALFELSEKLSAMTFDKRFLVPGALLSGFFGGLSGHQGALRSAFLLRAGLEKAAFIATGVMIACLVDVARIGTYTKFEVLQSGEVNYSLLLVAVGAAWIGALVGNSFFKKTSIAVFKWFVGGFMLLMGLFILLGIVE